MKAILALEDGRYFEGEAFGHRGTCTGEVCFNTSMTGYQEILTDPSYYGQIVAMTYPLIGNYGVNSLDAESRAPFVRGFVIEELSSAPSSWRSEKSLETYLQEAEICGIQGIDTRALTRHLRVRGSMKGCLSTSGLSIEQAVESAKKSDGVLGMDFVKEVSTPELYRWEEQSCDSRQWTIFNACETRPVERDASGQIYMALPPIKHHIVAYDFGIKYNILRSLRQSGFAVTVVPAQTSFEEVLSLNPQGLFLSNGPGDPGALSYIHKNIAELIGKLPIFGICLGHQILGCALGGKTFKLKFGHRGGNQPVQDLRSGKVAITSQNHGFALDADSLPPFVEVTHINLNDQTVEGIRHCETPLFSVQYHPEAAPGPHDSLPFFEEFAKLIEANPNKP